LLNALSKITHDNEQSVRYVPGTEAFCRQFNVKRRLLVGSQGIPLEEFLSTPADHWLE
jgi:hypothetical protein